MPLLKDSSGRPLPGKWDDAIEVRLPKALFMEMGGAEGGGTLTAELQRHCPTFFSSSDQAALRGWSLLTQARASPQRRTTSALSSLTSAVQTFTSVIAHIDLPKLLTALLTQRANLSSTPAAAPATRVIDAAIAELPLAAARAADPTFAADTLLVGKSNVGGISEWPTKLKSLLATRLRCYGLLLAKIELIATPPPPPAAKANGTANGAAPPPATAPAATIPPADDGAWLRVLEHALRVQPSDVLFHHAAFLKLLHSRREASLLKLPSTHLLSFATSPPLAEAARQVWSRFVSLSAPEELTSLEGLLSGNSAQSWPMIEELLASGSLLPRLHFENGRFVEAAMAFSELAERPEHSAPPPPSPAEPPLPPIILQIGQPEPAPLTLTQLHERQRGLEVRISYISMALAAAAGAGGAAASGLGSDFMRMLEENAQRGQLQLRLAAELAALITSPARLQSLLPYMEGHADALSFAARSRSSTRRYAARSSS